MVAHFSFHPPIHMITIITLEAVNQATKTVILKKHDQEITSCFFLLLLFCKSSPRDFNAGKIVSTNIQTILSSEIVFTMMKEVLINSPKVTNSTGLQS